MQNQEGGEFKNSLAALLAKGNPMMPGARRKTVKPTETIEEEEKEKIKVDIFNDFDEDDDKPAPKLENVIFFVIIYYEIRMNSCLSLLWPKLQRRHQSMMWHCLISTTSEVNLISFIRYSNILNCKLNMSHN